MAKIKADIQQIGEKGSEKFLITIPELSSEEEEARVLAEAIDKIEAKLSVLYPKVIPFRYSIDVSTDKAYLRSVLVIG